MARAGGRPPPPHTHTHTARPSIITSMRFLMLCSCLACLLWVRGARAGGVRSVRAVGVVEAQETIEGRGVRSAAPLVPLAATTVGVEDIQAAVRREAAPTNTTNEMPTISWLIGMVAPALCRLGFG